MFIIRNTVILEDDTFKNYTELGIMPGNDEMKLKEYLALNWIIFSVHKYKK